jgi:hypothetical protein
MSHRTSLAIVVALCLAVGVPCAAAEQEKLEVKYPKRAFIGTPKDVPKAVLDRTEKLVTTPPPVLVPKGTQLLSHGKPVTSSDSAPIIGSLDLITDGDKEATDGSWVELGPAKQWVQIDLGAPAAIHAILAWHSHTEARIYYDVVVQVSDDANFINGVTTLFNNDIDNSSGLGLGKDPMYIETNLGKAIDARGIKARYVRLYSGGNTADDQNHYTEVEVYGVKGG